jgi:hypothetical protein
LVHDPLSIGVTGVAIFAGLGNALR